MTCLCYDLAAADLAIETQKPIALVYRDVTINCAYRADLIVEGQVLVEVKSTDRVAPVHIQQLQTYLRLSRLPVGLLLNFGAPTMKEGIHTTGLPLSVVMRRDRVRIEPDGPVPQL